MMKAVLAGAAGGPEVLTQITQQVPQPGPGDVLVRVAAIGVNYADVMCRQAVHASMRPPPIVPGCEAAGVVDACGTGVSRHKVGDRVAVYSPFGGAYAEALVVPEDYALPLPDAMTFEEAAAFTHVYLTAYEALHAGGVPGAGSTVLITAAAGGLGGAVIQLGTALRLRLIAAVGSAEKRRLLLERGLAPVIDYGSSHLTEAVLSVTSGRGVDVAIETVGGVLFEQAQDALAPLGRIVIAGTASGHEPRPDVSALLARSGTCATLNLSVVFARRPVRARETWACLMSLYSAGHLRPRIGRRLPLAQAADAHRLMESRGSVDKILLYPAAPGQQPTRLPDRLSSSNRPDPADRRLDRAPCEPG
jgi:NADPH:quinone reductase